MIYNFITFEGIEGAGKSTQAKLLAKSLKSSNIDVILTREPGGCKVSEQIRDIIINNKDIDILTELFLIISARIEHLNKTIKPALSNGNFVVCDRFIDSTIAYQAYASGIKIDQIDKIHNMITDLPKPALTFIFNMDIDNALERTKTRNNNNKFEQKPHEFHLQVQEGFLDIYKNNRDRCFLIDATKSIEDIHKQIIDKVNQVFKLDIIYIKRELIYSNF